MPRSSKWTSNDSLLYYPIMNQLDNWLLENLYYQKKHLLKLVSVSEEEEWRVVETCMRADITLLHFNASDRHFAPWSNIALCVQINEVIACTEKKNLNKNMIDIYMQIVLLYCISKLLWSIVFPYLPSHSEKVRKSRLSDCINEEHLRKTLIDTDFIRYCIIFYSIGEMFCILICQVFVIKLKFSDRLKQTKIVFQ